MRWIQGTTEAVHSAFKVLFQRKDNGPNSTCHLLRLPADVLIDEIFPLLLVEDIIHIRQTNKVFYLLTHEAIIWRRFLFRMHGISVAQMRPTFNITASSADHEIEPLVTGACAMERAWLSGFPRIRGERITFGEKLKVVDIKLVPGGKFLVASVRDRVHPRFYLEVYGLDLMYGCHLLARLPTFHKIYDLQAKYFPHDGRPGIMISYTRRRFKGGALSETVNLAALSHKHPIDTVLPLEYDAWAVHMRLDVVERIIKPSLRPYRSENVLHELRQGEPPFRDVARVRTDFEVHGPSLFEARGQAYMGFIEDPGRIRVVNLCTGDETIIDFTDYPGHDLLPHRVRAFRYLPCQDGLLVIRTIASAPGVDAKKFIAFEFYDFPRETGLHTLTATGGWKCADARGIDGDFTISDPEQPGTKTNADHPDILPKEICPPTLWVFAPSSAPENRGIAYWWFRAEPQEKERDSEPTRYVYAVETMVPHFHRNTKFQERALPGTERTLLMELNATDARTEAVPLNRLRRFHWPRDRFEHRYPHPLLEVCAPVMKPIEEDSVFAFANIGLSEKLGAKVTDLGGLSAVTWDEGSGRVCLAADGLDQITVCDLAPVVEPHMRLAYKWRQNLLDPARREFAHAAPAFVEAIMDDDEETPVWRPPVQPVFN
ncbi:hypothetical protein BDN70DRAFT_941411 [Pholiota conissans]|uniref:F-box domain-containing protein n=1 Tax=Pholiota conissans TaxID=109636 RepID=A0A9P5ZEF3_9AGAR|nr:hypothetical protein BDN70DRAFT_941411 [Pholiota conissans]